jgi:hypothetical protein
MQSPAPVRRGRAQFVHALLALALFALGRAASGAPAGAPPAISEGDLVAQGRRIYEEGVLPGGGRLRARAVGGVALEGQAAACTTCHRPSGHGAREGESRVASITGPALYSKPRFQQAERSGRPSRPIVPPRRFARSAYDDGSLARAIVRGLDPDGHALEPLMPRYELGARDARALVAWLRQLGASADPGVEGNSLRFATLVTDDADPAQRAAFLATLRAWSARGAVSGLSTPLDVWELHGPADGWPSQLAAWQAQRPAFALVSALGTGHWEGVQEFCEARRLPCLFPLLDVAPKPSPGRYTYYLGAGARLEALALAAWLEGAGRPDVVQVAGDDAGREAAGQFAESYGGIVRPVVADAAGLPAGATTVVAWLRPAGAARLVAGLPEGATLYLSERLAPPASVEVPPTLRTRVRWISTRADPTRMRALAIVETDPWLLSLGATPMDEALQSELHVATWLVADALARMRGEWNREFLLETIESGMQPPELVRAYQSFSLAVGQRQAVRGARVLGWPDPAAPSPAAISDLLLP